MWSAWNIHARPAFAATLSAFGMLAAHIIKDYARTVMHSGDTAYAELEALQAPLLEQGKANLLTEGVPAAQISLERLLDVCYRGQSYELMIPFTPIFIADFHTAHARTYGYSEPSVPIEIVNVRLRAVSICPARRCPALSSPKVNPLPSIIAPSS